MVLDSYDLQRELGRGAFGVVHLAARRTDGELFAIKILEFDELGAAERQACLREAQLLSRLRHPNVIGFEDAALECSLAPPLVRKEVLSLLRFPRCAHTMTIDAFAAGRLVEGMVAAAARHSRVNAMSCRHSHRLPQYPAASRPPAPAARMAGEVTT